MNPDPWVLHVALHQSPVGTLTVTGADTEFAFTDEYLDTPHRALLGQVFEEDPRAVWRQHQRVPKWFENLLPERGAPLRAYLAQQLHVSADSDIRLLEALGLDLPGAIGVAPNPDGASIAPRRSVRHEPGAETDKPGLRFSVAGVQFKLSMVRTENTLRLAGTGNLGNWYVKFPGSLSDVPENEFVTMSLAQAAGLDVANFELVGGNELEVPLGVAVPRTVYATQRFDRSGAGSIHIEDLNQVLDQWHGDKYIGVSQEKLGALIVRLCGTGAAEQFLRWTFFNLFIGNEDAHLKNISLIYPDRVNPEISPWYDLVSTVMYEEFDRGTALSLAGTKDPTKLTRRSLAKLGAATGWVDDEVLSLANDVFMRTMEAETAFRSERLLSPDRWERLDQYRAAVPLVRDLS